jgi:beta-mannosidase
MLWLNVEVTIFTIEWGEILVKTISLDGKWKLYYLPEEEKSTVGLRRLKSPAVKCVDATVPGNVELDLMRSGELPDLFYGSNIYQLRPYETYEWWYEKEFSAPDNPDGRKVELVFHGVDCLATYWLNGELLGQSDNMFIEHRFDITDKLKPDSNVLVVRIGSPLVHAMKKEYSPSMWALYTNWEQLRITSASHCKILPYHDSMSITEVIKCMIFIDASSPTTYHIAFDISKKL